MKKQVLRIFPMLGLFVTLATISVYAQTGLHHKVNIPFEFSVGNQVLPAGAYTVRHMVQGALVIQNLDCSKSQIFSTNRTIASTTQNKSSLVFTRYGDRYFLFTIWTAGDNVGHEVFKSRAERELIRTRNELAKGVSKPQTVSVVSHQ